MDYADDSEAASGRQGSLGWRLAAVFGISILLVLVTRLPLMPRHLFSFDSVNLALALENFDPIRNQPQPPGYPLFVGEARLVYWLLKTPEQTFNTLRILICGLAVGMLYLLARRMFSHRVGVVAAALLFVNPPFWYAGLTSPLRLHLALLSILVVYSCWRAFQGEQGHFYVASFLLGLSAGFRPELPVVLLPLWAWVGWQTGRRRLFFHGFLLLAGTVLAIGTALMMLSGGFSRMLFTFADYLWAQTYQTWPFQEGSSLGWRRMAGRAILWTGMGALPWFWTIPFAWRGRIRWLDWPRRLQFLVWWFLPAFLFSLLIHIGDPGHALISIPAVCLLGGVSLLAAEERFQFRWIPILKERGFTIWISFFASYLLLFFAQEPRQKWLVLWVALVLALLFLFPSSIFSSSNNGDWRKYGPIVSLALLGNLFVFFAEVSLPQRTPTDRFRGWSSVADALRMGTYETSYDRVYWVDQMTDLAIADIAAMKRSGVRPLMVVCSGDGVPAWRKITFYYPSESVYALEERGQPATPASVASLWVGTTMRAQYSGGTPIRLPLPKGTRIVWVVGGGQVEDLARLVPLQKASALYYTDLPYNASSFRWGSFEFTPQ